MTRKKLFSGLVLAAVTFATVVAYGATSTSFTVNNVRVEGNISKYDAWDYNPFVADSVTAKTTATSVMDSITTKATIYYYEAETQHIVTKTNTTKDSRESSVTAKSSLIGVAYKGSGYHSAKHNNDEKSGTTRINW